jgi:aspartate racemase
MMVESARLLEAWGADFIVIPCNTAHAFLRDVRSAVAIEVLDMIGLVARALRRDVGPQDTVGLLATRGTIAARVFHDTLDGLTVVTPSALLQTRAVDVAIKTIKYGGRTAAARALLLSAVQALAPAPSAIIAGCTEVELALAAEPLGLPLVCPMELLAKEVVRRARSGGPT